MPTVRGEPKRESACRCRNIATPGQAEVGRSNRGRWENAARILPPHLYRGISRAKISPSILGILDFSCPNQTPFAPGAAAPHTRSTPTYIESDDGWSGRLPWALLQGQGILT